MPPKKNNKTILVAPLDWGLGHATRCIPIIRTLAQNGCTVIIATSGHHQTLLQQEFPQLQFIDLPGYGITYAKANVLLRLVMQLPTFFSNVRREHQWLQKAVKEHCVNAIISDNRYGLYTNQVPTVFITHQLQVQSPALFKWTEKSVRNRLYDFTKKFSMCWVPDMEDASNSLGGKLSHPVVLPAIPVRYIGWLTRFKPQAAQPKKYKLLISLSGPEPQRTLLETILLPQLKDIDGEVLVVRGLPGANVGTKLAPAQLTKKLDVTVNPDNPGFASDSIRAEASPAPTAKTNNVTIINHLPGTELQAAIAESEFFLSRCGYSTLMDLQAVACRCLFVPTPGQTEQEYLGRQMAASGKAVVLSQKNIRLRHAIEAAATLPCFSDGTYENIILEKIIKDWLLTIHTA